jgi:shikimate O-hydroxycinnamoyltransferase
METKVEVVETTLVAPSEETPRLGLWLSNLDVTAAMTTHTALVYYYPAPAPAPTKADDEGFFSPDRLRTALAKALVPFYPLAGRLGRDDGGRLQIECHGEGALFLVARADCAGEDIFSNYVPLPKVRRMFVPAAPSGDPPCLMSMCQVSISFLLLFLGAASMVVLILLLHASMHGIIYMQVTFLKCGGVVLGAAVHHALMDGIGAFHFIQTWSGLARGLAVSQSQACPCPPSHDRAPLRGRSPPHADFDHLAYSSAHLNGVLRPSVTLVYPVSPKRLAELKSRCAPGVSTYGAVTARSPLALHVRRARPCAGQRHPPPRDGQRPRPPAPSAPAPLLRERHHAWPRRHQGG